MLCGCSAPTQIEKKTEAPQQTVNAQYVKAVWLAYYELQKLIAVDENDFNKNIKATFEKLKNMGFNTVCVQVRPCADAFYYSNYFPITKYCFGTQGMDISYDPLKNICAIAKDYNLNIEAWINPYRVSQENDINALAENNIAKKWYNNDKTKSYVYVADKGIYFNPAVDEVTELIVNGVKEIVENYDVSAIHFDDYFYPTTSADIDKIQYEKHKNVALAEFRRSCVSNMVKSVYSAIKAINPNVRFGISPASNIENDYNKLYADVETWITNEGYVDYICPQVYFGFKNVYQPFMFTVKKWSYIAKCDMYVGLPLYKAGKEDKNAAQNETGRINEFKNNNNIIARQIIYLSKLDSVKGFYIFSYGSLSDSVCSKEVENMLSVMQNSSPQ